MLEAIRSPQATALGSVLPTTRNGRTVPTVGPPFFLDGFDRPRTVLESTSLWRRPPDSIVEALLADWRLHVGEGPPSDDTTILVVKRPLF